MTRAKGRIITSDIIRALRQQRSSRPYAGVPIGSCGQDTNSSGDRMVAAENIQSVRCAFLGIDHNQDLPRFEFRQAWNILPRYGSCPSLLDKTLLLGFVLHSNQNGTLGKAGAL